MGSLRRVIEIFNRCLESCKDTDINEARLAVVEVFGMFVNFCKAVIEHVLTMQILYFLLSLTLLNFFGTPKQV
jgi:hypothetical protein